MIYEAPHRVARTLADLAAACGPDRSVAAARELTKVHEELWRGTLAEARVWAEAGEPRGEWVLVVAGTDPTTTVPATDADVLDALRARLASGDDRRQAVAGVAADLHLPKRSVYQLALGLDRGGADRQI